MTETIDRPVVDMVGISKHFPGVVALDDVGFELRPGRVHALVGENGAGKSTLMRCLFGMTQPDAGRILIDGREVAFKGPRDALDAGISMIQQELHPVPARSVMENIWLGRFPTRTLGPARFVDERRMRTDTETLFRESGVDLPVDALAGSLSVSQVQQMELARALSYDAKVLILDEPTSSLSDTEVARLFTQLRDLRAAGVAIVYISHRMDEIGAITDEVSIMRDGRMVGTWPIAEITIDRIISTMVGRELTDRYPERTRVAGDVLLEVEGLTSADPASFRDVSFTLRRGEVLGIGGLVGAQRTELVESIFGLRARSGGTIKLRGEEVALRDPIEAKRLGIALLTEDRRATGVIPTRTILENTIVADLGRFAGPLGIVDDRRALRAATDATDRLQVRMASLRSLITELSGGNQQKVLIARWLLSDPDVLILDEPTRGIDVGAKFEIYSIVDALAAAGKGILMVSSEMPELLGVSDRILVMARGRVTGTLDAATTDQTAIMHLAADIGPSAAVTHG